MCSCHSSVTCKSSQGQWVSIYTSGFNLAQLWYVICALINVLGWIRVWQCGLNQIFQISPFVMHWFISWDSLVQLNWILFLWESTTGRVQECCPLLAGTSSTEPVWSWFKTVPVASVDVIFSDSHTWCGFLGKKGKKIISYFPFPLSMVGGVWFLPWCFTAVDFLSLRIWR